MPGALYPWQVPAQKTDIINPENKLDNRNSTSLRL